MAVRLQMDGLAELRSALRQLPEELNREASAIVLAHAEEAKRRIQAAYPEGPTGNLRRGVTVERNTSKFGVGALVRSRARHAHLFDFGSRNRRTKTNANRGRMPRAPEAQRFVPIVVRVRGQMVRALIYMVRRAGFEVEG